MSTVTEDEFDELYSYEPVDPADIPARHRPTPPGRTSRNPHVDIVKTIAGTGEARYLTVTDPGDEESRVKLVNKHARYLRFAAHKNDRSVRVWHTVDGDKLRIAFQDTKYLRRHPSDAGTSTDEAEEGAPE